MGDSSQPGSLVREIHQLVQGPARPVLEQACREWLEGRRQAIAEAPPRPEPQKGETLAEYEERSRPREGALPKLPWPLDGREVSFAGYCAVLAIYHDANCPRCERCPLFPMPQASGDLSDEEVEQATYDGVSWVLLRDAIAENPDADAMQDAVDAVRAELRRRGVLPSESSLSADGKGGRAKTAPAERCHPGPGDAQAKLTAALLTHHEYSNGTVGKWEPIGVREMAREADVSEGSASEFIATHFGSHASYKGECGRNAPHLVRVLIDLAGDRTRLELCGRRPPEPRVSTGRRKAKPVEYHEDDD